MVESTTTLRNRIKTVLSAQGYGVECFHVSSEALDALEASQSAPYAVIISSYMMPKMKGDEILKTAKAMSPQTQRILIADLSELETLVNAVNMAGINACLTLPFNDQDLLHQTDLCCRQHDMVRKQNHFKRLTQHQNRQLFQMAGNYKKKDLFYLSQLEQKKKEIRILESRIRSAGRSLDADRPVLLQDILAEHNIAFSPEAFASQFILMKKEIKEILETATPAAYITLTPVSGKAPAPAPETRDTIQQAIQLLFAFFLKHKPSKTHPLGRVKEIIPEDMFEVRLSEDNAQAFLTIKTRDTRLLEPSHVRRFLEKNRIINGVKLDHEIESWLLQALPGDPPFIIASAREAKYPKNAEVRYHFPTRFLHAGKINPDGSINFQDRGEIPYVEDGAFLAAKIFPEQGAPGIDVFGNEIPVDDPVDLAFAAGPGTRLSEDGVRIYASVAGQPHLDALGNVTVCPEFQIKGDLGFETGNVNFDGNVIVSGSVKEGFKVKCASLTAKEIQGAEIDISGDLNVSMGIVDTELVKVKGSVQAKFVHNSKISAFGDLIVQKEIIDSRIYLSGACINENGLIVNSVISAKMGIRAGNIGNPSAKPSSLTVGVDEHTNLLTAKIDALLDVNRNTVRELQAEAEALETEDQSLHGVISKHAYVQDRAQLELKDIEKKLGSLKASGNMAAYQKVVNTVKEIRINAKKAEEEINKGFDRQDAIALEISRKTERIKELEARSKELTDEKNGLLEFSGRTTPLPEVRVGKKIESGTKVLTVNSSLTLDNASSRCSIKEFAKSSPGSGGLLVYEMRIID